MDIKKKFTGMNKTKRDRRVKRFKANHPDATLKEIGEKFGVSDEMIRQIIKGV